LYRSEAKVKKCREDTRPRQRDGALERNKGQRLALLLKQEATSDRTIQQLQHMASDSTIIALQDMCQFKEYEYTPECKSLVDKLSVEDKSMIDWCRELLRIYKFLVEHL